MSQKSTGLPRICPLIQSTHHSRHICCQTTSSLSRGTEDCLGYLLLQTILKQQPLIPHDSVDSLALVGLFCCSQGLLMGLHSAGSSPGLEHSEWLLSYIWDFSCYQEWLGLTGSFFFRLVSHCIDGLAELLYLATGV